MPDPRTLTIQSCRHCGAGAPTEAHFCPQCERIMSLTRHGDYFSFFGLPRKLTIDLADLERRFRALSRQFHPDYYYNATTAERLASLERSSYLNDAYRVLKQPLDRAEYLLKLEGLPAVGQHQDAREMEPGLLEEVFALNEELDDVRAAREAGADPEELRYARQRGPRSHRGPGRGAGAAPRAAGGTLGRAGGRRCQPRGPPPDARRPPRGPPGAELHREPVGHSQQDGLTAVILAICRFAICRVLPHGAPLTAG